MIKQKKSHIFNLSNNFFRKNNYMGLFSRMKGDWVSFWCTISRANCEPFIAIIFTFYHVPSKAHGIQLRGQVGYCISKLVWGALNLKHFINANYLSVFLVRYSVFITGGIWFYEGCSQYESTIDCSQLGSSVLTNYQWVYY
jgi:hypothetical protein